MKFQDPNLKVTEFHFWESYTLIFQFPIYLEAGVGSRYLIYWLAWEPKVPNIWGTGRSGYRVLVDSFSTWGRSRNWWLKVQGEIYGLKTPKGWIDFIGFQYEICEQRKKSGCLGHIGDEILLNCVGIVRIFIKNNQYFMESIRPFFFKCRGSCGKEHSISLMWLQHPNFFCIFFLPESLSPPVCTWTFQWLGSMSPKLSFWGKGPTVNGWNPKQPPGIRRTL